MRVELEDASVDLNEACGLEAGDEALAYWTTKTFFQPATVLDDIEDKIEGRTAGITGTIFRAGESDDCVLVAEQVGFTNVLPAPRPRATPVRTPTPTVVRTPTPTPKKTATPKPTATSTPPATTTSPPTSTP